jgi:lysozyme family protein
VTEANVNYENPPSESLDGQGATSFIGGQFSAEMMGIAMQQSVDFYNFWSVIEGDSISNDIGYLARDGATVHPSYEHFRMMAEHFRGNALLSTDDQPNVKTFAAIDSDQIVVMILNQDAAASFPYTISSTPPSLPPATR